MQKDPITGGSFMLRKARFSLVLLLTLLFLLPVCAGDIEEKTYTFTKDDPIVPVRDIFLSVYDNDPVDIKISGDGTVFRFQYENVFRNTEMWMDFSTEIAVNPSPILPDSLSAALDGAEVLMIDFRDGDYYPGTAEISFPAGKAGASYALYEYGLLNGTPVVIPAVRNLSADADGLLHLTLTEAHDFLLIPEPADTVCKALEPFVPHVDPDKGKEEEDPNAALKTMILSAVIALVLACVIYFITRKILRAKRRKEEEVKKALTAKKKR